MRLSWARRRAQLLEHGLDLSEETHYLLVTRKALAKRAGVAPTLITHYFKDMDNLRNELMVAAVAWRRLAVVAQGLSARDRIAQGAAPAVRTAAVEYLVCQD